MSPRRRAIVTTLLFVFVLAAAVLAIHEFHAHWPGLDKLVAEAAEVVQPAPLSAMHRNIPELGECRSCHATASAIADTKCLKCHREIEERQEKKLGFHGTKLDGHCAECHQDHRDRLITFDGTAFNHRQTLFPLVERHSELECGQCHDKPVDDPHHAGRRFDFIGIAHDSCVACHRDPHRGELTDAVASDRTCSSCHDQTAWTGRHMSFTHATDRNFPLHGKHAALDCAACHEPATPGAALATADFKNTATDCASCHEDPHDGQFEDSNCAECHREDGFKGSDLLFRHGSVKDFPLTGAHESVACAACHVPADASTNVAKGAVFRGLSTDCAVCHRDPHEGSLAPKACTSCHDTVAWSGAHLTFDHRSAAKSDFLLDATHAALSCSACHATEVFKPTATECASCHVTAAEHLEGRVTIEGRAEAWTPSPHAGLLKCVDCHDTTKLQERIEDISATCAKCHTQRYATLLLEQRAHLLGLVAQARGRLDTEGAAPTDRRRAILEVAERASSHDYEPAERQARAILDSLKKP